MANDAEILNAERAARAKAAKPTPEVDPAALEAEAIEARNAARRARFAAQMKREANRGPRDARVALEQAARSPEVRALLEARAWREAVLAALDSLTHDEVGFEIPARWAWSVAAEKVASEAHVRRYEDGWYAESPRARLEGPFETRIEAEAFALGHNLDRPEPPELVELNKIDAPGAACRVLELFATLGRVAGLDTTLEALEGGSGWNAPVRRVKAALQGRSEYAHGSGRPVLDAVVRELERLDTARHRIETAMQRVEELRARGAALPVDAPKRPHTDDDDDDFED
ncbi:MAG: hypothetical protein H6721_12375 [Sandaracinus sp.]|nr:hypothetical protein [Sandaracinus sp.]